MDRSGAIDKVVNVGGVEYDIQAKDFMIDENNLNFELCNCSQLIVYYGDIYAESKVQLEREAAKLKKVRGFKFISSKGKGNAVATADAEAEIDPEFQSQKKCFLDALQSEQLAASAYNAIKSKANLLQAFAYKQNTELKNTGRF